MEWLVAQAAPSIHNEQGLTYLGTARGQLAEYGAVVEKLEAGCQVRRRRVNHLCLRLAWDGDESALAGHKPVMETKN